MPLLEPKAAKGERIHSHFGVILTQELAVALENAALQLRRLVHAPNLFEDPRVLLLPGDIFRMLFAVRFLIDLKRPLRETHSLAGTAGPREKAGEICQR